MFCFAQSDDGGSNGVDTTYIKEFPDKLNLRALGVVKSLNLNVRGLQNDMLFYYGPRHRSYVGIGGLLWNIGFSIMMPVSNPGEQKDCDMKRLNLQGSLFANRWLISGIYQRYKGYYIMPADRQGAKRFRESPFREPPFREQMLSRKIEGTITYLPGGNKLSMRAPFNQSVKQIKSAGSFVMSASFSHFTLQDKQEGILPQALQTGNQALLRSIQLSSLNTSMGYACTLVHRNFFLHLFGLTGLGFQLQQHERDVPVAVTTGGHDQRNTAQRGAAQQDEAIKDFSLKPVYDGRAALGFDNGDFYAGVYTIADYNGSRFEQLKFEEFTTQIRFFVGLRLDQPTWLSKLKPAFLEKWQNNPIIPLPSIFE